MRDFTPDFSLDPSHAWLNAASEGPLPNVAAKALNEAIGWKMDVHQLTIPKFQQVPLELKKSIAKLIGASSEDIILGNSATYGVHLLANGLPLKSGDEVLLMQNDFPTDILPWLSLEAKGIKVIQAKPSQHVLTPEEIQTLITLKTKVICLPLIHSFSGWGMDIKSISQITQSKGIALIVNLSQAAGAFPVQVNDFGCDAVISAGYKWLLGPYGTGFCWMTSKLRESLNYPQNYWISIMDEKGLTGEDKLTLKETNSARRYDVFGTANFFNYVPWKASIDYLSSISLEAVASHNRRLTDHFIDGIDPKRFHLISPVKREERTNIVVFSHKDVHLNQSIIEHLKEKGLHLAIWKGKLRLSPHIYNNLEQIDACVRTLNETNIK